MRVEPVTIADERWIIIMSQEVTEHQRADEAREKSEAMYRHIIENAGDAVVIAQEGRIVFFNSRLSEVSGYARQELLSRPFTEFIDPEDRGRVLDRYRRRLAGETVDPKMECRLIDKDGQVRWTEFNTNLIEWEGRPATLTTIRDITDHKRAEEALQEAQKLLATRVTQRTAELEAANARLQQEVEDRRQAEEKLRESEERYRFLAENMADIVWTLDLNLQTTYVSPSVEKVLGFTPEERKRQTLEEVITPESLQIVLATFREELQRGGGPGEDPERSINIEVEFYHRDGSTVWLENNVKWLRDQAGAMVGIYGSSRDITERKRAEEERERLIGELQDALVKVKTLRGLIPICSNCKKIRDDKGFWQQVEVYVREHSEAEFSHGICPECMKKLYPSHKKDNKD
ncbi:MAG: PAS domain S-box protein [Proteobacteria bacterium]|nr:PAS domain S-box protein [Pseudomonadota bacterium]MBU1743067.1 PAS domain S-box protein [Pseudomonadota bacterium]